MRLTYLSVSFEDSVDFLVFEICDHVFIAEWGVESLDLGMGDWVYDEALLLLAEFVVQLTL